MTDMYTFEDDLDRNLPEDERSGLTVHDDGEHFVFGLARGAGDNREVYLTPDMAENLAALLVALTLTPDDLEADDPGESRTIGRAVLYIAALAVLTGALYGLATGAAAAIGMLING